YFLFSKPGEERFLLNMGGISNFTFLPGSVSADRVFATDTGPGNTLIDACMRRYFNQPFDLDGRVARSGNIDGALLAALLSDPFFDQPFPKSTGPELFSMSWVEQLSGGMIGHISQEDMVATMTELTAVSIAQGLLAVAESNHASLYVSGGGAHNPVIMASLRAHLHGWPINPVETLG
ncbi:MAG: anhydro-N-acetylmuramic acid kinase, partial [Bacteroidota bacterium]